MRQEFLQAERLFAIDTALKMLPPPANKDVKDLHAHVRKVVLGEEGVRA